MKKSIGRYIPQAACLYFISSNENGVIKKIKGINNINNIDGVSKFKLFFEEVMK